MLKLKKRYEEIDKEDLPARFAKLLNKSASSDDPVEFLKAQVSTKEPRKQPVSKMEQALTGGKTLGLLGGALGGVTGRSLESALKGGGAGLLAGSLLGAASKPSKTRVSLEDKPEAQFYQDAWRSYNPDAFDEQEYAQGMEQVYRNKTASVKLREWLRNCIEEELDAISLYENYAEETDNPRAAALFQEVADDEKHHVADFMELLLELDEVQDKELEKKAEFLGLKPELSEGLKRGALIGGGGSLVGLLAGGLNEATKVKKNNDAERIALLKEYAKEKGIDIKEDSSGKASWNFDKNFISFDQDAHSPSVLAHELGHAITPDTPNSKGSLRGANVTGSTNTFAGLLNSFHPNKVTDGIRMGTVLSTTLGLAPALKEEYKASKKGLEILDELGIREPQDKKRLIGAYGTYLSSLAPGVISGVDMALNKQASVSAECLEGAGKGGQNENYRAPK